MPENHTPTIAEALGFTHGMTDQGPCPGDDSTLIFVERYVGVESRRIISVGDTLVVSSDALSDEPEDTVEQYVECRYCHGTPVPVDPNTEVTYE